MTLDRVASTLNELLSKKRPAIVNSSWILRHAPACYRFIQKWIRSEIGGIDWDRVTHVLDPVYQRRWKPQRRRRSAAYADADELIRVMNRYRPKLYVFINPLDAHDRRARDTISIALVRVAQSGNILAQQELMELIGHTIESWVEHHPFLSRWRGYKEELRRQVEGCIRRYRYTGSFIRYLYKTLEYAARGVRPLIAYSLDEPLPGGTGCRIDLITSRT
jgi:hypothetical protein